MIGPQFASRLAATVALLVPCLNPDVSCAQDPSVAVKASQASASLELAKAVLNEVRDEDVEKALQLLGDASVLLSNAHREDHLTAAIGGVARALNQLDTAEQYELLHDWSMPTDDRKSVRLLTAVVPEISPPSEFARALGQRPKKNSFAVASVGEMPGFFCSAWTMVFAADDAGELRQLIPELEGLAKDKVANADFVLTLARIIDSRSDVEELTKLLKDRIEGDDGVPAPSVHSDAVLVAAGVERKGLGPVCEQIVERLNKFDLSKGTSRIVPFLRRLRANVILKNRSPETDPRDLFYLTPSLWISANDQRAAGSTTGADEAVWLTHEDHVKRLAGPGDDLLLLKYPLTGKFELKGEVAELEHGGGGMTYGGLAFDANSKAFTLVEAQRGHSVNRVWPFVAPKEHRMFNRVNLRSDGEKFTFLSNLHPGFNGTATASSSSPWLGLRAFGDGRIIFRNLELVGEPTIPREVKLIGAADLRGWTSSYGEATPKFVKPFPTKTDNTVAAEPVWNSADGVIIGKSSAKLNTDEVSQSHLTYIRPCLDGETVSYEFFYEEGKSTAHPALGRVAFLMEVGGIRLHWLTDNVGEWTALEADNAIIEPLNRRGPRQLPLKDGEWNSVTMLLAKGKVSLTLNGEEIYRRSLEDMNGRHFGIYHDKNKTSVKVRNVVLTGDWPEKLSAEQLGNLVAFGSD